MENKKQILIPEVIKPQHNSIKEKSILNNINLTKNDNRKNYEIYNTYTQHNNTTINNNRSLGLFSFIIFLITLPFRIVFIIFKFIFVRLNIREKINIEHKKNKIKRMMLKHFRKMRDVYNTDEIF